MQKQINTSPITQFAQLLRATELSQQKEVKIPIHQARLLNLALTEMLDQLHQDYTLLLETLQQKDNAEVITVQFDGGSFSDK
jgi:hypothetical protein